MKEKRIGQSIKSILMDGKDGTMNDNTLYPLKHDTPTVSYTHLDVYKRQGIAHIIPDKKEALPMAVSHKEVTQEY